MESFSYTMKKLTLLNKKVGENIYHPQTNASKYSRTKARLNFGPRGGMTGGTLAHSGVAGKTQAFSKNVWGSRPGNYSRSHRVTKKEFNVPNRIIFSHRGFESTRLYCEVTSYNLTS